MKTILVILIISVIVIFLIICNKKIEKFESTGNKTIIIIRHGEKPSGGLGELTCQGLNRSLALPKVLSQKYGKPNYIFAPDPSQKIHEGGGSYNYIRPLATINPTANRYNLPVNASFGYMDIKGITNELKNSKYDNKTIFIAWEHKYLVKLAKLIMSQNGGDSNKIPEWTNDNYDTIFIFKINNGKIAFSTDKEGLNGLSQSCPN
jgi:hypothetical protein